MSQLADDCFAFGGPLMPMDQALQILQSRITAIVTSETLPLALAHKRILAEPVYATADQPPAANAAVDGYALAAAQLQDSHPLSLKLVGRVTAGHASDRQVAADETMRILTGAEMPPGTDTVVMQEDVTLAGERVEIPAGLKPGANCRQAGEDFKKGECLLPAGKVLRPQDIGLAAAAGMAILRVFAPLRIALFSTGDELIEPGQACGRGKIYDANRYLLTALLQHPGFQVTDLGILPDSAALIQTALGKAAAGHDLIITSGGVSTGDEDHVRDAVTALGRLHFWRLAIKPGRPIALGQIGDSVFLGLPGNPVAAFVCLLRFGLPVALTLAGAEASAPRSFQVPAGFAMKKKPGRREWLRASLQMQADGRVVAERYAKQGSGVIRSLVDSEGLIELDEEVTEVAPGDVVRFFSYQEVLS